ncbi:MAG: hypothetical protein JWR15_3652 [Prosthecobacter sp.]|nr:hypothetical protein [Prosthecobacter sp.]
MNSEHKLPEGFGKPTQLPSAQLNTEWQHANRTWWETTPMRYDWNEKLQYEEFSRSFYEEIDKRFFFDNARYMPPKERPFDEILPFDKLKDWDVLEIGVGNGSHAQLMAPHCKSYTGIDLTNYAVQSTSRRFELFELKGTIRQMDAENLEFPAASFDYVWSWGVIHHSANTERILSEISRVLKPGGKSTIMVYYRSFLYYWVVAGFIRGVLMGGFLKTRSIHELVQLHTDGAIARFYTSPEWQAAVERNGFTIEQKWIKGQKSELFPLPASRLKDKLMALLPNSIARFFLNTLRQGSFIITTLRKV